MNFTPKDVIARPLGRGDPCGSAKGRSPWIAASAYGLLAMTRGGQMLRAFQPCTAGRFLPDQPPRRGVRNSGTTWLGWRDQKQKKRRPRPALLVFRAEAICSRW